MFTAARWSITDVWYRWFSAFLSSPASLRLRSSSATSFFRVSVSVLSVASLSTRDVCVAPRSFFSWVFTVISSSVLSMTVLHDSHFWYSCFCCACSSTIILSITSMTFVKESRRVRTARDTSAQSLCFWATFAIRCIARSAARSCASNCESRRPASATDFWTKLSDAFPSELRENVARASSSAKIFSVSARARISSVRTARRFWYSSSSSLQLFSSSARKASSASRAFSRAALSSLALDTSASKSARAFSLRALVEEAMCISEIFADLSFW
mmetsp:Transcript_13807/g.36486  ORF Transcript_13807/g.36486 Transcript_13807/m.36486 type:complete len:271 (-) Transcript_13807:979-1791(-)